MSDTLHLNEEEVHALLQSMDRLLQEWKEEVGHLRMLRQALAQVWDAPATADFVAQYWWTLEKLEDEVDHLREQHQRAWREMEEWLEAGRLFSLLFAKDADDAHVVSPDDLAQGTINDCFLIASMAAIALQNPEFIKRHIKANPDNTYMVTFYRDGKPVQVTVIADDFQGLEISSLDNGELWPLIYEKAYAKLRGGYSEINKGGLPSEALETLTGKKSQVYRGENLQKVTIEMLDQAMREKKAIVVGTPPGQTKFGLHGRHAYYVSRIDREHGVVYLRNPWGWSEGEIKIPFKEFSKILQCLTINPVE